MAKVSRVARLDEGGDPPELVGKDRGRNFHFSRLETGSEDVFEDEASIFDSTCQLISKFGVELKLSVMQYFVSTEL